jgi:hypothetical protein
VGASNATLPSDNIVLVFSENIAAVSGGTITLVNDATNTSITITTTDTTQVTITDNVMTINPTEDLMQTNNYHIEINEGAVTDLIGHDFAAIIDSSFNFTVDDINDAPTGGATITGPAKTGQTLTVTNNIIDIDGITSALNYQWSKTNDAGTTSVVTGASDSTYILTDDDIGFTFENTVSYTDDGGFGNTVVTSATAEVTDIVKLIQIRNISTTTASQASIDLEGIDKTEGSDNSILKFDVYIDAEDIAVNLSSATGISGAQFKLSFTDGSIDSANYLTADSDTDFIMQTNASDDIGDTSFNLSASNSNGSFVLINFSSADLLVDNNVSDTEYPSELLIATVYVDPEDSLTSLNLQVKDVVLGDQNTDTIPLLDYYTALDIT